MNFSYKRYWEPSTPQVWGQTLIVGSIANTITYPIEFVKTRIQVRSEGIGIRNKNHQAGYNPHQVFRQIHSTGVGFKGFYQGIDSYLAARVGYLFIRNTIYKTVYDMFAPVKKSNDLTTREKAAIAAIAGGSAALITNPLELVNTRTIADGGLLKQNRRNYTGLQDGLAKIQQEGSQAIWRGGLANVIRAVVLNIALTGPYDYINEKSWITFGDMPEVNNTIALFWATMWATLAYTPVDNIKTRLMIQFPDNALNRIGYKGYMDCVAKIFQNEGIFSFWVGYYAQFYRVLAYSVITLGLTNPIKNKWKKDAGLESWQM